MIILFIIVLLVIGIGMALSTYMLYAPFVTLLWDIKSYNIAYYGAQAWLERWLLTTRYKEPWFVWSWWRNGVTNFWATADGLPDRAIIGGDYLWRLSDPTNSVRRENTSRTLSLPAESDILADVQYVFSWVTPDETKNSSYFGVLYPGRPLSFLLSLDQTSDKELFFTQTPESSITSYDWESLTMIMRLPPYIQEIYDGEGLCLEAYCDIDGDRLPDDVVVSRWWWGTATTASGTDSFTIIPHTNVRYNTDPPVVDSFTDSNIRKSVLNTYDVSDTTPSRFVFFEPWQQYFDPVHTNSVLTTHNIISQYSEFLNTLSFASLLSPPSGILTKNNTLTFTLVSPLVTRSDFIYPFLEYRLTGETPLADSAYRITGQARVWEYNITLTTSVSTSETSTLSDFTIIF